MSIKKLELFPFYKNKSVLITGGGGFIGSHLTKYLIKSGANVTISGYSKQPKNILLLDNCKYIQADLIQYNECKKIVKNFDFIFQVAGISGSIEYSSKHHGTLFTNNALINLNMLRACSQSSIKRYQYLSSVGVYPNKNKILKESDGFKDNPVDAHFGYGWAKRLGELQCKLFSEEFGMKISVIRPDNTYGPRDIFDLSQARVIPSLIRKIFDNNLLYVWGSGNQKRTFVYVKDLVRGMLKGLEKFPKSDPVNISSGREITIKKLVNQIVKLSNKKIKIIYDISKPESSFKRCMDISKAKKILKYQPIWDIEMGLKETIDWYKTTITTNKKVKM